MANIRQYIGARYVIKIYENSQDAESAEWESNTNYEPLTMVTYQNGSYLSKKQVPATVGNPAANAAYWTQTGFYNGQIASLQAQIDAINNTTIPAINNDIADLEGDIAELLTLIDASRGNYIFIGDSYNNPQYSDWGNYAATELGLTSGQYASLYIDGGSISGGQFDTLIAEYAATLTQEEKDSVSHIVCGGGINDTTVSANDLKTRMASFISLCKSQFRNATVYMAFIGNSVESSSILHNRDYAGIARALEVYRNCATIGGKYLEGLEYVLHDYSLMASDGIHPTQDGGAEIGKYIKIALINGKAHIMRSYKSTTTGALVDNSSADSGLTINEIARADNEYLVYVNQDNNTQTFTFWGRLAVISSSFMTCNASTHYKLGTCKLDLVNGKKPLVVDITANGREYNDNTKFHNVKACTKFCIFVENYFPTLVQNRKVIFLFCPNSIKFSVASAHC